MNIVRTITTLKQQDYPNLHIYFVDDGSKDHTLERVREAFDTDDKVTVLARRMAVGFGTELWYRCLSLRVLWFVFDADTQLKQDAVSRLMKHLHC